MYIKNNNILQLENRRRIYDFIRKNPGLHFSELYRYLEIPKTTLFYHINYLKKNELIKEKSDDNYSRYFIIKEVSKKDKQFLSYIRKKIPRYIIFLFLSKICLSCSEISRELNIHPHTVDFHLKKLHKLGLIETVNRDCDNNIILNWKEPRILKRKPLGNEIIYTIKSPVWFYEKIIIYKKSLLMDEFLISMIEYYEDIMKDRWLLPKKLNTFELAVDFIVKLWYDTFPMPICA